MTSPGIENAWSVLGARRPWQGSSLPPGMRIPTVWPVLENSLHPNAAAASAPSQVGQGSKIRVDRVQAGEWDLVLGEAVGQDHPLYLQS